MIIVNLHTNRLLLRKFHSDDALDLYTYLSHDVIKKALDFNGCSLKECQEIANKRASSDSYFAVTLSNKLIGHIEFHETKYNNVFEIGYVFNPNYHAKGYAFEALTEVIDYAKIIFIKEIVISTSPLNISSINLAKRLGFVPYNGINKSDYPNVGDCQYHIKL